MYSPLSTLSPSEFPSSRSRSSQDLFFTHPGLFIPPPHPPMSSGGMSPSIPVSAAEDHHPGPHVWSPLNMGHFGRIRPTGNQPLPWNSALLSAYMLQLSLPNSRNPSAESPDRRTILSNQQQNLSSSSPESSAS